MTARTVSSRRPARLTSAILALKPPWPGIALRAARLEEEAIALIIAWKDKVGEPVQSAQTGVFLRLHIVMAHGAIPSRPMRIIATHHGPPQRLRGHGWDTTISTP